MLGVIGGTGFYSMPGVEVAQQREVATPYGEPSNKVSIGALAGVPIAFLPRHGSSHGLLPSEINYRANIYALKSVGVTHVLSVSAVGSLREELQPGEIVIPSQYLDLTKGRRAPSFFGDGLVGHLASAQPICSSFVRHLLGALEGKTSLTLHSDKVYACVEGPRLGTQAESFMLRTLGGDVVGMTNVPEVFLAREAQLSYASFCIVTDYDSWHEDPDQHVSVDSVMAQYRSSVEKVQEAILQIGRHPLPERSDVIRSIIANSLLSKEHDLPTELGEVVAVLRR